MKVISRGLALSWTPAFLFYKSVVATFSVTPDTLLFDEIPIRCNLIASGSTPSTSESTLTTCSV